MNCAQTKVHVDENYNIYLPSLRTSMIAALRFDGVEPATRLNLLVHVPMASDLEVVRTKYNFALANTFGNFDVAVVYRTEPTYTMPEETIDNTVCVYFNPLKTITLYGRLGTHVFTGFLTAEFVDCLRRGSIVASKGTKTCQLETPTSHVAAQRTRMDMRVVDILQEENVTAVTRGIVPITLCFSKPSRVTQIEVLCFKRFLILGQRYRTGKMLHYALALAPDARDALVLALRNEMFRRLLKTVQIQGVDRCPLIYTVPVQKLYNLWTTLHPKFGDRDTIPQLLNVYKPLIPLGVVPHIFNILVNCPERCTFSFQCRGRNYILRNGQYYPANVRDPIEKSVAPKPYTGAKYTRLLDGYVRNGYSRMQIVLIENKHERMFL